MTHTHRCLPWQGSGQEGGKGARINGRPPCLIKPMKDFNEKRRDSTHLWGSGRSFLLVYKIDKLIQDNSIRWGGEGTARRPPGLSKQEGGGARGSGG